jgi:proline dehydrogenase
VTGPLLRAPILWLADRPFVRRLATERGLGRRVALRFVAGETLDDGAAVARRLNERGIGAMLDRLGENVTSAEGAAQAAAAYVSALRRIEATGLPDANISVKLTQLGLDVSYDLCLENTERVLRKASGTLVMIDMESSRYTDRTLDVYEKLRANHPNVGVCLQAYLHRTPGDLRRIAQPGAVIRLAKGAYLEPPDVAIADRLAVSRAFARLGATALAAGCTLHIATHDPRLLDGAKRFVAQRAIPRARHEFQMLYGIRRDLQDELRREGRPIRVYIPYGSEWFPYLTRRLAERPANVWFFISNLVRR